jgi:hypothetical protein
MAMWPPGRTTRTASSIAARRAALPGRLWNREAADDEIEGRIGKLQIGHVAGVQFDPLGDTFGLRREEAEDDRRQGVVEIGGAQVGPQHSLRGEHAQVVSVDTELGFFQPLVIRRDEELAERVGVARVERAQHGTIHRLDEQ